MQKSRADPRVQEIGDQCTEAYIGEKMVGHMNAVVAVKQYENAGKGKSDAVSLCAAVFQNVCQHWQRKHHAGDGHVTAGPAFKVVIASRQVRYHLPP